MKISIKPKYKYLHIEILNGQLYVYPSDKKHRGFNVSLCDIEQECRIDDKHIYMEIKDLVDLNVEN